MARPHTVDRDYGIKSFHGPFATIYQCPCCKHVERFTNGRAGTGRGHGLRMGGGCYSRMVAHVRKEHPHVPKNQRFNVYAWRNRQAELVATVEARNAVEAVMKAGGSITPDAAGNKPHLLARDVLHDPYAPK